MNPATSAWRSWPDWARVIAGWRCLPGRYALSLHALGSLCKRDPNIIIEEVMTNSFASIYHCDDVEGPVVKVGFYRPCTCDMSSFIPGTNLYQVHSGKHAWPQELSASGPTLPTRLEEAKKYLALYPWPKYRGLLKGEGVEGKTGLIEVLTLDQINLLRRIAKGEVDFKVMMDEKEREKK